MIVEVAGRGRARSGRRGGGRLLGLRGRGRRRASVDRRCRRRRRRRLRRWRPARRWSADAAVLVDAAGPADGPVDADAAPAEADAGAGADAGASDAGPVVAAAAPLYPGAGRGFIYFRHGPTLSGVLRVDNGIGDCAWSSIPGAAVTAANCVPVVLGSATVEYGPSAAGLLGHPDFALAASDTVLRNRAPVPTGDDVFTHRFPNQTTAAGCTLFGGTRYDAATDRCSVQFLRNAHERFDDGVGNDNGLCESGEDGVLMPNIGSYQGEGDLILETTIGTGGALENIRLFRYATNGR